MHRSPGLRPVLEVALRRRATMCVPGALARICLALALLAAATARPEGVAEASLEIMDIRLTSLGAGSVLLQWGFSASNTSLGMPFRPLAGAAGHVLLQLTPSGATVSPFPGSATETVLQVPPDAPFGCYLVAASNATGSIFALSYWLCAFPRLATGQAPTNLAVEFILSFPAGATQVTWDPVPGAAAYDFLQVGGDPPVVQRRYTLPGTGRDGTGASLEFTCFMVVAYGTGAATGYSDAVCAKYLPPGP